MNVINFPGNPRRRGDREAVQRAIRVKQRLIDYVLTGEVREDFDKQWEIEGIDGDDAAEAVDFVDWFLFCWVGENGERVLDMFLEDDDELDDEERALVESWSGAIDDVFRVRERSGDGFDLEDSEGRVYFTLPTNRDADDLAWEPGTLVGTRILPVGDQYILSGAQTYYDAAEGAENGEAALGAAAPSLTEALHDAFVERFGSDEIELKLRDLPSTVAGYRDFVDFIFTPPYLDKPLGQALKASGEDISVVPDVELPREVLIEGGDRLATLVSDPQGGLAFVPGYGVLRDHLRLGTGDPDELKGIVAMLLGESNVPSFVLHRLAAIDADRFGKLVGLAIDDESFDVETDLDDLIEELKPTDFTLEPLEMDDEVVTPEDIVDVRTIDPKLRVKGSIADYVAEFLDELKPRIERPDAPNFALYLSLLAYYGESYSVSMISDLDTQTLLDFLTAWYPRAWSERGDQDARDLLQCLFEFFNWVDLAKQMHIGSSFEANVFEALKLELPRTAEAAVALESGLPGMDLSSKFDSDHEDEPEDEIEGLFEIAMIDIDINVLTVIERFEGDEDPELPTEGYDLAVTLEAAAMLDCGDLIEGTIVLRDGTWRLEELVAVYCSIADV